MGRIHLGDHRSRGHSGRPLPEQNAEVETRDGAVPVEVRGTVDAFPHEAISVRRSAVMAVTLAV